MDVFPELYTSRLHLRRIMADDIPALVQYANNPAISARVLNIPYPYGEPEAVFRISYVLQGFRQKTRYVFAIILQSQEILVGEAGLHLDSRQPMAQLGYWIGEPFWNQGIATEAVQAVLQFAINKLNLETIFATCDEDNIASIKVLEKCGMKRKGSQGKVLQYVLQRGNEMP